MMPSLTTNFSLLVFFDVNSSSSSSFAHTHALLRLIAQRDFILTFLKENKSLIANKQNVRFNHLIKAVCVMAHKMVSLRFYKKTADQQNLFDTVLEMLDGMTDKPEQVWKKRGDNDEWIKTGRFAKNAVNKAVVAAKHEGMLIVKELMDSRASLTLAQFIQDFVKVMNSPEQT